MIKISLVQFDPQFLELKSNFSKMETLVKGLETDILVFPELASSGYSFIQKEEALRFAKESQEETLDFFKGLAKKTHALVIAGFPEYANNHVFNSALIAFPNQEIRIYRKTHLFFKEKECFDAGDTGFFVVHLPEKDCRIGTMVCNDWRYPESARSLALLGADIIVCPSNLVSEVWKIGMAARALENKVYVAVANRYGDENRILKDGSQQNLRFNGNSILYDFNGKPLLEANSTGDQIIHFEIDPILTRNKFFNPYNDLLKDRRPDLYIY